MPQPDVPPPSAPLTLPPPMRVRGLSAGQTLLLALLFLLHAVAEVAGNQWPFLAQTLFFARVSLLALWIGLGPLPWFVRGPLGALGIYALLHWGRGWQTGEVAWQLVIFQTAGILLVSSMALLARVRMRHYPPGTAVQAPEMQFSIGHLLVITVLAAVAFAGSRVMRPLMAQFEPIPMYLGTASLAAAFAMVALLAVWAMLPAGATWRRWVLLAMASPLAGAVLPYLFHRTDDWLAFAAWTAGQSAVLAVSLGLIRGCGFRLIRLARLGNSSAARSV